MTDLPGGPPPSLLQKRQARERVYRATIRSAVVAAVLGHAALFVALAPFQGRIPLVRHLGYEGPLRILPEISVQRDPGPVESEFQTAAGAGARAVFQAVDISVVDREPVEGRRVREDTGIRDESVGDDLLAQLERTLPQPTSRDLVILRLVKPDYPASSVLAGVEGVVAFRVHVASDGTVARAWLLNSEVDRACDESARRALLEWRFRPYLREGEPADVLVDQRIRFTLTDALRRESAAARE
jgi:TonB family protein